MALGSGAGRARGTLAAVAVAVVVAGVGTWTALHKRGPDAAHLLHVACDELRRGFMTRGAALRPALDRANAAATRAARASATSRAFAAAVARFDAQPATRGLGTFASPTDVEVVQQSCAQTLLSNEVAIATRAPYLTDVTTTSVLVNFATDRRVAQPVVHYGPAGGDCTQLAATTRRSQAITFAGRTDFLYSVELDRLAPGRSYCYRLDDSVFELASDEVPPTFSTAAAADDPRAFSFAVIGDWGGGTDDEARVLAQIAASPAQFVITVGDNAYVDGTQADYGDLTSGNVFGSRFWPIVGESRPVFAAAGNHGFSNFRAALDNWPEPSAVRLSGGRQRRDDYCCTPTLRQPFKYASTWYAFDWGGARFYVLDGAWADRTGGYRGDFYAHWNGGVPQCAPCGVEQRWLAMDLAAHRQTRLKFAFFHFPLYADASDHTSDTLLDGSSGLEGLLARNGVDIVFNGHAHLYERNRPQLARSPMISYVTGGGGVNNGSDTLAMVHGCSAFDAYAIGAAHTSCRAPKPVTDAAVYHFLLVTITGSDVTVTPTDENGLAFDVQHLQF
jgi:hypothetical protein